MDIGRLQRRAVSPVNGDIWFDGTDLKLRSGGTTYTITKT